MNDRIESRSNPGGSHAALVALALTAALALPLSVRADGTAKAGDGAALTDGNVAAIVLAANTIDIKNGELAAARSKNRSVQEFARRMVTDHTSVNGKASA